VLLTPKNERMMVMYYYYYLEAHRALELLEEYHKRLVNPQDRALRLAIEKVIRIFKSRLFNALMGEVTMALMFTIFGPVQRVNFGFINFLICVIICPT
jgi:hypothetical protein